MTSSDQFSIITVIGFYDKKSVGICMSCSCITRVWNCVTVGRFSGKRFNMDLLDVIVRVNRLTNIELSNYRLKHAESLLISRSFYSGQHAQSAQADLNRCISHTSVHHT